MDLNKDFLERLLNGQEKYTYYLLSVSASCIGFSLFQTREAKLSLYEIPLGLSVLTWGFSFFCGCKRLLLGMNYLENHFEAIFDGILGNEIEKKQRHEKSLQIGIKSRRYFKYQLTLIILGAAFYVVWHILGMYNRTVG